MKGLVVAFLVAATCAAAASAAPRPAKPRVLGPRRTGDRTPTFRFVSTESGIPSRALHFRCSVTRRLHPCPRRYTPNLRIGRHVLRVLAVDPSGRRSPTARVIVRILKPHLAPAPPDQTISVGSAPYNVAYGFGSLWVPVDGEVVRLDPATGAIQARVRVGGRPWGVAFGADVVWVGNLDNQMVAGIDPRTNSVGPQFRLPGSPVGVAVGGGALWAANNDNDEVWRLDPATGQVLAVAHVGDRHEFVGFSEGRVWVASEDGTIAELDPATGAVTKTLIAGSDADYLGFSPGSVWASNYATPFLWRIDAATGKIAQRLRIVTSGAQGVEDDGTSLWVAMYGDGLVLRVDRSTGAVLKRYRVGRRPRGLTIAAGSVWVANSSSGTISRIGLGR
jgi:DNA-binding beta-propeller fold protein YncE